MLKCTVYKRDRDFSNSVNHFRVSSENVFNKSWTWQFIQEKLIKLSLLDNRMQEWTGWEITGVAECGVPAPKPNPLFLQQGQAGIPSSAPVNICQCPRDPWEFLVFNPCDGGNSGVKLLPELNVSREELSPWGWNVDISDIVTLGSFSHCHFLFKKQWDFERMGQKAKPPKLI